MSRVYDITFDTPSGRKTIRSGGNTKRSAIRSARAMLCRQNGFKMSELHFLDVLFVPESKRTSKGET